MTDLRKRYRRLADAEQILLTKAAILPLDHSPAINLINTNVIGGWYSNPLDIHPFKFLSVQSPGHPAGHRDAAPALAGSAPLPAPARARHCSETIYPQGGTACRRWRSARMSTGSA